MPIYQCEGTHLFASFRAGRLARNSSHSFPWRRVYGCLADGRKGHEADLDMILLEVLQVERTSTQLLARNRALKQPLWDIMDTLQVLSRIPGYDLKTSSPETSGIPKLATLGNPHGWNIRGEHGSFD